jgi:actin-related protein
LVEQYLKYIVEDQMKDDLSQTPLMMIETPIPLKEDRLKMVELVFEKMSGCALSMYNSALLTSYLYSKENSFVIDVGANSTYITPIFDGFAVSKCTIQLTVSDDQARQRWPVHHRQTTGNPVGQAGRANLATVPSKP